MSHFHNPIHPTKLHRTFLIVVLILTAIPAWKLFATLPVQGVIMDQVVPAEARAGQIVTITGFALDTAHVGELYLIDEGDTLYKADILSATGRALQFRVPAKVPPGVLRIAVRAPRQQELIDQMVYLKVLEPVG